MKITFLGNFGVTYSSESHYLKTFKSLGHQVNAFQEPCYHFDKLAKSALLSDMFFWVHTHGWVTPRIDELLKMLNESGIPSVGYHLDLWLGLERQKDLEKDSYWKIKHFYTADKNFADYLNENDNLPQGHYLPAGVFAPEAYVGNKQNKFNHEVIFVGSKGYHPEWQYRPQLINWLGENYKEKFGHYGGDGLGVIRGNELNDLYASAKIAVGDTLCIGFNYPDYFSDRLFESTGRGAFIIFPYIKGIEELFKVGKEIVTYEFNNWKDLKDKIDYYLAHDIEREEIRQAGHLRTKKDHTYTNRLNQIINDFKN